MNPHRAIGIILPTINPLRCDLPRRFTRSEDMKDSGYIIASS